MVAIAIAQSLEAAHCMIVGNFDSLNEALSKAKNLTFDAAIINSTLGGEESGSLEEHLIERGIPYVVISTNYSRRPPAMIRRGYC